MNENRTTVQLRSLMDGPEGWGRSQGRGVYQRLLDLVEAHPGVTIFRVSLEGVKRVDISFASETLVEIARRYRGSKGFCFFDLTDPDMIENWEAAASRKNQPIMLWRKDKVRVLGIEPSQGNLGAFKFAVERSQVRAVEFASATKSMTITNASTKFKQLWEQGFLLRRDDVAESGGIEYTYYRIC